MRWLLVISVLGLASLFGGASAVQGAAAPTPKAKSHGNGIAGTVVRIDSAKKLLVVRAGGHDTSLEMTPATGVHGGPLAQGQRVAVRWLEKDGKKVATSVRVEPPSVAGTTPTATAGGQP